MSNPKAIIFGCKTTFLLEEEKDFFQRINPLGFILFKRNCRTPDQLRLLIHELRQTVNRPDAPVLIDQEGGTVARLAPPYWRVAPAASTFGIMAEEDPEKAGWCARANAWLIGRELQALGITVNCAPVVDLSHPTTHAVIGDRAFNHRSDIVSILALQTIRGFQEAGVISVIKHIPGHGRATVDSHEKLPIVYQELEELAASDFEAFRQVCLHFKREKERTPWAMTSHILYPALDKLNPATNSQAIIDTIIRGHIGFTGFLISDCLTMKALEGNMGLRAKKALEAGCDAVLHCSGVLEEMIEIAAQASPLKNDGMARLNQSAFTSHSTESYPSIFLSEEETLKELNDNLRRERLIPLSNLTFRS